MISIYLCEDDNVQLQKWSNIISNHLLMNPLNATLVYETTSGIDLLQHLSSNPPEVGLYYLDIDLNEEMTGFVLASKIRELDPRGYIVFITTHSEMCFMTFSYKVEALDFILKDRPEELELKMIQCISAAANNYAKWKAQHTQFITFKIEGQYIQLDTSDILYIESAPTVHKVLIHTRTGIINIYHSIKSLELLLDSNYFYRCNKSAIVNIKHIKKFIPANKTICLVTGEKISISAKYYSKFRSNMM